MNAASTDKLNFVAADMPLFGSPVSLEFTKRRQTRPSDYGSPESQEVLILIH